MPFWLWVHQLLKSQVCSMRSVTSQNDRETRGLKMEFSGQFLLFVSLQEFLLMYCTNPHQIQSGLISFFRFVITYSKRYYLTLTIQFMVISLFSNPDSWSIKTFGSKSHMLRVKGWVTLHQMLRWFRKALRKPWTA